MKPIIQNLINDILSDEDYDKSFNIAEILSDQEIIDAVQVLRNSKDSEERRDAEYKIFQKLLPAILEHELQQQVCSKIRSYLEI